MAHSIKVEAHIQGHAYYKQKITELTPVWITINDISDVHNGKITIVKRIPMDGDTPARNVNVVKTGTVISAHHGHMGSGGGHGVAALVSFFVPDVDADDMIEKIERNLRENMDYARTGPMPEPKKEA